MIVRLDHIDLRVEKMSETIETLSKLGLILKREMPARHSVEMTLPGENQVVFEIHEVEPKAAIGVHHIAFKTDDEDADVESLKEKGIVFKGEKKIIKDTGRLVSSFSDLNGIGWQLTD